MSGNSEKTLKIFDGNSIENWFFIFILEKLLLKIEPSEITPFFYNNFFGFGVRGIFPPFPLATVEGKENDVIPKFFWAFTHIFDFFLNSKYFATTFLNLFGFPKLFFARSHEVSPNLENQCLPYNLWKFSKNPMFPFLLGFWQNHRFFAGLRPNQLQILIYLELLHFNKYWRKIRVNFQNFSKISMKTWCFTHFYPIFQKLWHFIHLDNKTIFYIFRFGDLRSHLLRVPWYIWRLGFPSFTPCGYAWAFAGLKSFIFI